MPWLSRNDFKPSDFVHADDLNSLANDQRTWGGDVNGGGYTLSNVNIVGINPQAGGGGVTSVFGRTGDVIAKSGDYTPAQVGAVPLARQVIAGPGITGGGPLSADVTLTAAVQSVFGRTGVVVLMQADITSANGVLVTRNIFTGPGLQGGGNLSTDRTLSVIPDSTNQQIQVMVGGNLYGTRHAINFLGSNVAVQDNPTDNRVNITVTATGGGGGMTDPTTQLGDLIVRGTAATTRLAVGTNGQVLTADSTQPVGVRWVTPIVPAVASVFGRIGAIVAVLGDYTAAQVTNAVDQTATYNNPGWIASLPWAKITNAPAFLVDPMLAKGDLIVHGATTVRLPAGADGTVLTADSSYGAGSEVGSGCGNQRLRQRPGGNGSGGRLHRCTGDRGGSQYPYDQRGHWPGGRRQSQREPHSRGGSRYDCSTGRYLAGRYHQSRHAAGAQLYERCRGGAIEYGRSHRTTGSTSRCLRRARAAAAVWWTRPAPRVT